MKIGELAQRSGMAVSTLRYYEKRGLLDVAERTDAGYREYSDSTLRDLRIIASAKNLGFTLEKIKVILQVADSDSQGEVIGELVSERLQSVREEIKLLNEIERVLNDCLKDDGQLETFTESDYSSLASRSTQRDEEKSDNSLR